MERRDSCSVKDVGKQKLISNLGSEESIGFTRPLDKAYRFFQDGHVQNIRYHPMPNQLDYICIGADVLPSMKKDKLYKVYIVLSELTSDVAKAFCACPAGLSVHAQLGYLVAVIMSQLLSTVYRTISI